MVFWIVLIGTLALQALGYAVWRTVSNVQAREDAKAQRRIPNKGRLVGIRHQDDYA